MSIGGQGRFQTSVAVVAFAVVACSRPDPPTAGRDGALDSGTASAGTSPPHSPGPVGAASSSRGTRERPRGSPDGSVAGPIRYLAIGGGSAPSSTEVSLEQDVELLRRTLPAPTLVLFAGGSRSRSVRELEKSPWGDPVRTALGELFSPREGRQSRYRTPRVAAEPATLQNVERRLSEALARDGEPLLVYVAAHGDRGARAEENSVALWGGQALTVARLAELHERSKRGLRLVATSCFSGGFAELAFARADAASGRASPVPRCGLFAGTHDRQTSGCDPNPDRRAQEAYGLHFLHSLGGTGRNGAKLEMSSIDFDGDGRIGLLDAHTWARIESRSLDVPTTTSERWLRANESRRAPIDWALLPEETAVVRRLGEALGLGSEAAARARWQQLADRLAKLDRRVLDADDELAEREADQGMRLLERWPVLDDPYHPDFEQTFARHHAAIERSLSRSGEARGRAAANARLAALRDQADRVGVEEARVLRLLRAYETLAAASALHERGGPAADHYAALLACERSAP